VTWCVISKHILLRQLNQGQKYILDFVFWNLEFFLFFFWIFKDFFFNLLVFFVDLFEFFALNSTYHCTVFRAFNDNDV
jgi:hypothetical protein